MKRKLHLPANRTRDLPSPLGSGRRGATSPIIAVTLALSLAAILPAIADTVVFEDGFEDLSQWSGPTNNPTETWIERIIEATDADSELFFGEAANSYLRIYKNHSESATNAITANDAFSTPSEVITISFDLWDNSEIAPGSVDLMVSSAAGIAGTRFFHIVKMSKGVLSGVTGSYRPDQRNRLQIVMNNSANAVAYLNDEYEVASDSMDVWVDGILVLDNHTYNRGSHESLPVGTPLASLRFILSTTSRAEVLVDNLRVDAGAVITDVAPPPAFPEPLVEFAFEADSLENSGLLGGEGTFSQTARTPTFGAGVAGGTAMDNRSASGMGQLAWQDGQDGALFYQPGAGLNDLVSITVTGWFWTEADFNNRAMPLAKPNSIQIEGRNDLFQFNVLTRVDGVRTSRILSSSSPWHRETGRWVFFAVTADVTEEAAGRDNAFMYYAYDDSEGITLDSQRSIIPGPIDNVSSPLAVANYINNHPLQGLVDNLRIWGSTVDGAAALSPDQIEKVWAADLGKAAAGFAQWAAQHFSEAELGDESISGRAGSPAGDGIPNILKYAFGLNPHESARDELPKLEQIEGDWRLSYTRRTDAPDIAYVVESSTDLVAWAAGEAEVEIVGTEVMDETFERITIRPVAPPQNRLFLRVRIEWN